MESANIFLMRHILCLCLLLSALVYSACSNSSTQDAPIPIKVVVVAMFEIGEVEGDRPGEFQYWVERLPLHETLDFPQGYSPLRYNAEKGILGVTTGIGTQFSTATIMGLGMDPRFDLSNAYWLVAGIAGGDPEDTSPADAVWTDWAIDGDIGHEIDPREAPEDWPTGYIPFRNKSPYQMPLPAEDQHWGVRYKLNPGLLNWAYELTKDIELTTSEGAENLRLKFKDFDLICPTEREARISLGNKDDGVEVVANKILDKTGCKNLILKLGAEGFITYGESSKIQPKRVYWWLVRS